MRHAEGLHGEALACLARDARCGQLGVRHNRRGQRAWCMPRLVLLQAMLHALFLPPPLQAPICRIQVRSRCARRHGSTAAGAAARGLCRRRAGPGAAAAVAGCACGCAGAPGRRRRVSLLPGLIYPDCLIQSVADSSVVWCIVSQPRTTPASPHRPHPPQLVLDCFPEQQQALLAQLAAHPQQQFAFLRSLVALHQGGQAGQGGAGSGDASLQVGRGGESPLACSPTAPLCAAGRQPAAAHAALTARRFHPPTGRQPGAGAGGAAGRHASGYALPPPTLHI